MFNSQDQSCTLQSSHCL